MDALSMSPETIRLVVRGVVLFVALGIFQLVFGRFFNGRTKLIPTSKLPEWLQADPELAAAREKLILRMVKLGSWFDLSPSEKFGRVFLFTIGGGGICLVAFLALAFVCGIACPNMKSFSNLPDADLYAWVFRSAFIGGLIAAVVGVAWRCIWIEQQWNRLRHLSNKALSIEYDAWMEYHASWKRVMDDFDQTMARRYETELANSELARQIGVEMVKAGRQLEYERHTTIYPKP
jgi:hypothetical protein